MSVNPDFIVALHKAGSRGQVLRLIASGLSEVKVFEACARSEITPEEGAWILALRRDAEPWPVRFIRWVFA